MYYEIIYEYITTPINSTAMIETIIFNTFSIFILCLSLKLEVGFRIQDSRFKKVGFRIQDSRFRIQDSRKLDSGFRIQVLEACD